MDDVGGMTDEQLAQHEQTLIGLIALAQLGEMNQRDFILMYVEAQMTQLSAAYALGGSNPNSEAGKKYLAEEERISKKAARSIWKAIKAGDFAV